MPGNPLEAYQAVERNTLEGRALEAMVLSKAAVILQGVCNDWDAADRSERLDEALRYNQRLWTFLQTELANDENPLPLAIRQNLLTLSKFIDKRTFEIMASPAKEKLDILININQNISAGLRGQADDAASQGG
jgi:flagellar protein FlaF